MLLTPEQIQKIAELIAEQLQTPWHWGILLVVAAASSWLGAFLAERGKISAMQTSVRQLTNTVEEVRNLYAEKLSDRVARHQLRMACIEQRLRVNQKAFTLWRQLCSVGIGIDPNQRERAMELAYECQDFWFENCLFMEADVREAFHSAFQAVIDLNSLLPMPGDKHDPTSMRELAEMRRTVRKCGSIIVKACGLPPLSADEPEKKDAE